MAITYTQEDIDRVQKRYGAVFEQLRHYNSQQISDILVKAHNDGLLAICGALFDDKDVDECYVALMIALKILKDNNLILPKENETMHNTQIHNTIVVPENATNGDVIKAMFPNIKLEEICEGDIWFNIDNTITVFHEEWWNAPYNKEKKG